ncbi:ligase [Vibrio ponticus]|uniref:Ligase n=1 Tax=Vibrio ponticus TaxID=265668 RepID=A0ABX3F7P2_9VIBR|nr:O-antigen ligase family protein [Vibrio ponticus]OLQ86628.1 ligase [Vibrio ponticus]
MNNSYITKSLMALPFIWVFSGLFMYENSDKHFFIICLLSFFTNLYVNGYESFLDNFKKNTLTWIIGFATISCIITKINMGGSSSELRVFISLLLLSICTSASIKNKINNYLPHLIFIGTIISLLFVSYHALILKIDRSLWSINAIPYTTFTAAITSIAIYYVFLSDNKKTRLLSLTSVILGSSAILISQTRGSLLALLIALFAVVTLVLYNKKNTILILLIIISTSIIVGLFSFNSLQSRYIQTKQEVTKIYNGNLNTSIGYRIQMWKAGLELSKQPTIFGLGNTHIQAKKNLFNEGKISEKASKFKHYHNQIITNLIMKGIVGLSFLILLLGYPAYNYLKNRSEKHFLAFICSIVYFVAGLTDIPLSQPHSLAFYLVMLLLLCTSDQKNANSV